MFKNTSGVAFLLLGIFAFQSPQAFGKKHFIPNGDVAALRQAIEFANVSDDEDIITLSANGLYALTDEASNGSKLGLPVIKGNLIIHGNDAEIRRYASQKMALLKIARGATVSVTNLTLAEGNLGAVINEGNLQFDHVKLQDNIAHDQHAILTNRGQFTAIDSSFSFNEVSTADAQSTVLLNYGEASLDRCDFSHNMIRPKLNTAVAAVAVSNYGAFKAKHTKVEENIALSETEALQMAALVDTGNGQSSGTDWMIGSNQLSAMDALAVSLNWSASN